MPKLGDADMIVLSRFAYLRRRGNEMVLESPRAGALFKICDPKIATAIAVLSTPQKIKQLRRQDNFPGAEPVTCCKTLRADTREIKGLQTRTDHSPQHGRNTAVRYPFAEKGRPPVAQKHQSKSDFQDRAKSF